MAHRRLGGIVTGISLRFVAQIDVMVAALGQGEALADPARARFMDDFRSLSKAGAEWVEMVLDGDTCVIRPTADFLRLCEKHGIG